MPLPYIHAHIHIFVYKKCKKKTESEAQASYWMFRINIVHCTIEEKKEKQNLNEQKVEWKLLDTQFSVDLRSMGSKGYNVSWLKADIELENEKKSGKNGVGK